MKRTYIILLVIVTTLLTSYQSPAGKSDLERVRNRVREELMKSRVDDSRIETLINSLGEDGSWPDIDYKDVSRTGFDNGDHVRNLVLMARAYRKESSDYYQDKNLKTKIISALQFWNENDFICDNWWWNQIGTPDALITTLLIMDKDLPQNLVDETLPIIGRAHINAWGARQSGDRIKIAGISAKHYLYLRDQAEFEKLIKIIEGEIRFVSGRGMQYDYSFHHRVDRVNNTLSYGTGYADAFVEWAVYVKGTEYTLSEEKVRHLIDYYLDGICKHMVYGKYPDPGAKNRSVSRRGTLRPAGASVPEKLLSVTDYRKTELEEIAGIRNGTADPTTSHSVFYWHSEHYTHQRPDYFTSVRMFSTRNHNMEQPYNSEGLLNHHRGDGTNHISVTGEEYMNIFPVFDYQKVPGATIVQKPQLPSPEEIQKPGLTDFVGAVTDGKYGAAAFDFISPHDLLKAKKSWFFFDDEYVCLGTGIDNILDLPAVTTVNQCLLNGPVKVSSGQNVSTLEPGTHELDDVQWVFHNQVGYLFPEKQTVYLTNDKSSGSWYRIHHGSRTPKDEVSMDLFTLWLDHGHRNKDGSYQYIVVPAASESKMEKFAENKHIEILSNSRDIQAVRHSGLNITQVVFYTSGEIRLAEDLVLTCNSQGMVMIKTDGERITEITISDPSRKLASIKISMNVLLNEAGNNFTAAWDVLKGCSDISIDLPQDHYAGKSVTIQL